MLQTGPREEKRRELKAEYQEALLRVENARNALTRLEPAFKADSISREAMNQARDELRTAEAAGAAAQARLELGTAKERPEEIKRAELAWRAAQLAWARLKAQPRLEDVKTAEARVAVAEARLAAAKASLAKTVLLAAKAGVVLQVHAREGERVDGPVLVLGDLSRMRLRVEVDEHDVGRLQIGQKVVATARGLGEQEFSGRVTQIGRRMGRKRLFTDAPDERADTHVLEALVELDGRPDLPTGFRFRVLFYDKEREPTLKQSNGDE
jgi:multidrug resistance efflux pump